MNIFTIKSVTQSKAEFTEGSLVVLGPQGVGKDGEVLVWQRWDVLYTHKAIVQMLRSQSKAAVRYSNNCHTKRIPSTTGKSLSKHLKYLIRYEANV